MTPKIIMPEQGVHNSQMQKSRDRLISGDTYKDISTICIIPTRGVIPARVIQGWFGLMTPMNQKFFRMFMTGMEVGQAYSHAIEYILADKELSRWKYILTLEEDNMPPPDGLLKLYESIKYYDAVGGLYWTKGEGGQPMIYGNPKEMPLSFRPQLPAPDQIQPCCGLGMGFTLFRTSMFKHKGLPRPLFKTEQSYTPGVGAKGYTQDLYFFENAGKLGYRFASDNRVKVGHYDYDNDMVW